MSYLKAQNRLYSIAMALPNSHKIGNSNPESTGSGRSSDVETRSFVVELDSVERGVLPLAESCLIVITEKTRISKIPDNRAAIGAIQPSPLTVDMPANAITSNDAPSNRIYLELPVIQQTRTKHLMNLIQCRLQYVRFW